MSDTTSVQLMFPQEFLDAVTGIYKAENYEPTESTSPDTTGMIVFCFDEVNHGYLPHLDKLTELGIPFDSEWGSGDDFRPGCLHNRYTHEGFQNLFVWREDQELIHPDAIKKILAAGGGIPQKLLAFQQLVDPYNKLCEYIKWDNQIQYGKLYRMNQLLQIKQE